MNVTLIIPAKNQFDDVDRIFKSLIKQNSKRPISAMVIDQGSTDGMKERLDEAWDQRMAFLVVGGDGDQNLAYKKMFERARSEIVIILHPNNFIDAEYLNTMIGPFEDDQRIVGVSGPNLGASPKLNFFERLFYGSSTTYNETNIAVRKSAYDQVGGIQPSEGALAISMLFSRLRQVGKIESIT